MCIIRLYRVKPDLCTRIIIILESAATAAVARIQLFLLLFVRSTIAPPPHMFTKLYVYYTVARIEPAKYRNRGPTD